MSRLTKLISAGLMMGLAFFLLSAPAAHGQLNSNTATVTLSATLGESLTVSAAPTSGSAVNFTLVSGGTATGSAPVAMTTSWVMKGSRSSVTMTGYFSSAAQAMAGTGSSPAYIPTSEILGQVTTGAPTTFTAFTQTPTGSALGTAGASLVLFTQAVSGTNRASSRTDNLNLQINLTSQPQLPADTYTGTLNLQAQAL
ncbi:MAG TPA: hypothetical protein VIY53_06015 [Acidobacteriaceae bacterium]